MNSKSGSLEIAAQKFISICEEMNIRYILFYQEQIGTLSGGLKLSFKEIMTAVELMTEKISTEELSLVLQVIAKRIETRCLQDSKEETTT